MRPTLAVAVAALAAALAFSAWNTRFPRVLSAEPLSGDDNMAIATFAAGCFWGVEETFRNVPGVTDTAVGYTGGHTANPTYEEVCSHTTGHAEAVRVVYDPTQVTYEELLKVFWDSHNPTTPDRQGPDVGSQYRSAVFYHTPEQRDAALRVKEELVASGRFGSPIVTKVTPASEFYVAEEYHQQYLARRSLRICRVSP